jgi:hypothetical protein
LCNNFEAESVLDTTSATVASGAIVTWWLNDPNLFNAYRAQLDERSDTSGMETQITALAFLVRCLEICARRMNSSTETMIEGLLADRHLDPGVRLMVKIAQDEFFGSSPGFYVEAAATRRKFVQVCLHAVEQLIGIVSVSGYPPLFLVQDLIIAMQRLDVQDGRLLPQ